MALSYTFSALSPKIEKANKIIGKNINFTDVKIEDSNFIVNLRTQENKKKYISQTENNLSMQEKWISNYLVSKNQAYFIIRTQTGEKIGTVRMYDNIGSSFCWGSWILKDGCSRFAAIESALIIYHYAIYLGFDTAHIDVRNQNKSVLRFHQNFGAEIVRTDSLNTYLVVKRSAIYNSLKKYSRFLPNGIIISSDR